MIINYQKIKIVYGKIVRIKNPFLEIEEINGKIQIYSKLKFNIGDIIFVIAKIKKTKLKILFLIPFFIKLIIKNIKIIKKKNFSIKKKIFSIMFFLTNYLNFFMFLNINSSNLCKIKSSSNSNNFKTYLNLKKKDFYLKISPEFNIKKLLSTDISRIYEITKCYRNEGISCIHNYEFTMLEYYSNNLKFNKSIFFLEQMIKNIFFTYKKRISIYKLNFKNIIFFKKKSILEFILMYFLEKKFFIKKKYFLILLIFKNLINIKNVKFSNFIFKIFDNIIKKNLIFPIFVKKFTKISSPLTKPFFLNLKFSKRFELYISSIELSNGFDELNDYYLQKKNINKKNKDFLIYLKNSLSNLNGVGIGIDRLILILNRIKNIKNIL